MRFKYSWDAARKDLLAGMTVAAISLPQGMAYALIAGIDPRFGLYSAIVVTAVASILGSSSHLINGPTNAISLVVFSALASLDSGARYEAYQATFLLGVMVGIIQILIAVFKLGDLTRYISESVVLGFMAGAGCLVALGQVGNLLGIRDRGTGHQQVVERFWLTLTQGGPVNRYALVIGLGTILLVVILRKLSRRYRLPQVDMLLALITTAAVATFFGWSQTASNGRTLLAVVGNVPASLPLPHVPEIRFWWVKELSGSALAIAFLGLLEALAIAKSIAHQTRQTLDYNKQCLAEGVANLTGGFFQCLPGSGSLTRSAINFQAGAVTRMSGVFAAATTAAAVLLFAPLARYIPKAALAGLLLVIAARLVDWDRLRYAMRASRYDAGLVLITALAAVFISVEFSILIGVALSILLFVPRAARLRVSELVVTAKQVLRERLPSDPPCPKMLLYNLEGELFFGAAPELDRFFDEVKLRINKEGIRVVVLRFKRTRNPDMVCLERLQHFLQETERERVVVLLCGVRPDLTKGLANLRFADWFPADRVFPEGGETPSATLKAVGYAYELLEANASGVCDRTKLGADKQALSHQV
jgi:SulP family sulfate permease